MDDAQSVQNADTAREKGYDSGKRVSGMKRHIAVDINGLPHAVYVTRVNISDKAGTREMIENNKPSLCHVSNILCDGGYIGKPFAAAVKESIGANVEIVKHNELHRFAVLPKRRIVERLLDSLINAVGSG